mgnify:CR=1 FL=1
MTTGYRIVDLDADEDDYGFFKTLRSAKRRIEHFDENMKFGRSINGIISVRGAYACVFYIKKVDE